MPECYCHQVQTILLRTVEYLLKKMLHVTSTYGGVRSGLRSCSQYTVVRTIWLSVNIPALRFAKAVTTLQREKKRGLKCRQWDAGHQPFECPGVIVNKAVQDNMRWSPFEAQEAMNKLNYYGRQ